MVWKSFSKNLSYPYKGEDYVAGDSPTQEGLKRILHYVEDTGKFIWKFRGKHTFTSPRAMNRFYKVCAGKDAGFINSEGFPTIKLGEKDYRIKKLVWLWHHGYYPTGRVVELDGDKLNTRIENLSLILSSTP